MHEVFINYRTGDGDEAAALVEKVLSDRFGKDRIFRAARSIVPGEAYPQALVSAVRRSAVLLAVMGADWARCPQLREENDWVRREILEAYANGIRVIPVLKGRKTGRLNAADLPPELARLADVQSLRLDTRDNGADLARIGDELADLVPSLKEADRASRPPAPDVGRNSASGVHGTVVQARDITGPFHAGKGDIYQDSQHYSYLDDPRRGGDER